MKKKYHCPVHKEDTPSAHVYGNRFKCFGCGARGPITDLGLKPEDANEEKERFVENVAETFEYILSLPVREFRGLRFPCSGVGYYVCWADHSYYKLRLFNPRKSGDKYRSPSGVRKPPLILPGAGESLALVEGEINALSLKEAFPALHVVSPGGAGDFYGKGQEAYVRRYAEFPKIHIFTDNDKAGGQAAIEMKVRLLMSGAQDVRIHLLETDFNDTLVQEGLHGLKARANICLGM